MTPDVDLWQNLRPGDEVTVVKTHYTPGRPDYRYPARMIASDRPGWFAFEAVWALPDMDVDGILYETDGRLVEYFSPEQRYNVFHVYKRNGETSGYYANVTEFPTLNRGDQGALILTWIDCWLDVIKLPTGEMKLLDEDEFADSGIAVTNPELAQHIRTAAEDVFALLSSDRWPV